jgi:hypothetical protein
MREEDPHALYRSLHSLGDADNPVPGYLPPWLRAPDPVVKYPDSLYARPRPP